MRIIKLLDAFFSRKKTTGGSAYWSSTEVLFIMTKVTIKVMIKVMIRS